MGNRQANTAAGDATTCNSSTANTRKRYQQHKEAYYANDPYRSKTLPTRRSQDVSMHPRRKHRQDGTEDRYSTSGLGTKNGGNKNGEGATQNNGETSRVLFLLYLIHRTWNVVVDTVDTRSKSRSRRCTTPTKPPDKPHKYQKRYKSTQNSDCSTLRRHHSFNDDDCTITITDLDDIDGSSICSQYSCCSCSYCYGETQNVYNSITHDDCSLDSICARTLTPCESDYSAYYQRGNNDQHHHHHQSQHQQEKQQHREKQQMAPSVCRNSPKLGGGVAGNGTVGGSVGASSITQKSNCGSNSLNGSMASYKMTSSEQSWPQAVFSKENQRPPVYNPEDYVQALKKFGKRHVNGNGAAGQAPRSIYDTSSDVANGKEDYKSSTLPAKHSEYKSPIPAPPESDSEMTLRQFASITDLLTKLRADLRVSFPSFVQEFVATPSDGVSLLLEILRAIQLAQASNAPLPALSQNGTASMPRNAQSYQRRALLDELACLQCLSICCSRSLDATARLGNTPVGLMPLASSATGQGIRARILALQLLSAACDKQAFGHGSQKIVAAGHTAVSEAMSTLRLRCSEPVRFRLLVGMLNSGGGSGELQCAGVKFICTFLESAINLQQRLYLQAELFQAGFEPATLARTISSSSPWLDSLRAEIKRFNELYVDVDKMIGQARDADRVRSQMVILERRVQILHEEKTVLTTMERRLQERCAELQREIFRLQGAQHERGFKPVENQPIALPRQVTHKTGVANSKQDSSEHEDEGISSSETGPSLSPVPILVLPQNKQTKHKKKTATNKNDDEDGATIEDVMEELDNIVSEAEKEISKSSITITNSCGPKRVEKDIVPVNIVPQPPRKTRSLAHLVAPMDGSEIDGSEFGMLLLQNQADRETVNRVAALHTFFDETDYDMPDTDKTYAIESPDIPEANANTTACNASTNRELLDVIMNARHTEDDPTIKALRNSIHDNANNKRASYVSGAGGGGVPSEDCSKQLPPAQQFNGVFFMTGMNTPQKYPKPDLTAALQARRVTKNIERLEAAFASSASHEALNEAAIVREKSRSNQQIYFGSNPALRLTTTNIGCATGGSYTSNQITIGIHSGSQQISTRTRSYTQGSKVTDLPSGLY